jgi:hypothetical protein
MISAKDAKFDEITQSSMLISLFSGVDPKTKYFENIPILMGGEGLITDHQARLKVEEVSMIIGRLFELFFLERPMTANLRTGIVNVVDVMIRRYLIDKHGYASASSEETLEIAYNLL